MLSDKMMPMAACSGGRPKPRNDTAASCKIACGNISTKPTKNCGARCGSRWCRRIQPPDFPSLRDTATYCCARSCSTSPRMRRASEHQCVAAMPASRPVSPRPRANEMRMIRIICGTPITRSMTQPMAASSRLEPVAAATPTSTAMTALMPEAASPTVMLTDRPLSVRRNRSRPSASVPKGWARLGGSLALKKLPAMALSGMSSPQAYTLRTTAARMAARMSVFSRRLRSLMPPPPARAGRPRRKADRR